MMFFSPDGLSIIIKISALHPPAEDMPWHGPTSYLVSGVGSHHGVTSTRTRNFSNFTNIW